MHTDTENKIIIFKNTAKFILFLNNKNSEMGIEENNPKTASIEPDDITPRLGKTHVANKSIFFALEI